MKDALERCVNIGNHATGTDTSQTPLRALGQHEKAVQLHAAASQTEK